MQATIEAISKNGKGILVGGTWWNADKKAGVSFDTLKKGMGINLIEVNENFVKKFEVTDTANAAPAARKVYTPKAPEATPSNRDAKITMGNAYNAVFAAVYTANFTDSSHEEAFKIAQEAVIAAAKHLSEVA